MERISLDDILEALRCDGGPEIPEGTEVFHDSLRQAYLAVKEAEGEVAGSMSLQQLLDGSRNENPNPDLDREGSSPS